MMNLETIEAATPVAMAQGIRVFNGALFGPTEEEHVAFLLGAMSPPPGAMVIDAGCGIGEAARIMSALRPDLQFLLVNVSAVQLSECPEDMDCMQADFDAMPLPDGCADVIVFSYALCHSPDFLRTLHEARRLLKTGGMLFINDMARTAGDNAHFERALGAVVHSADAVEAWARVAGFALDYAITPDIMVRRLAGLLDDQAGLLDNVTPTIWRFTALDATAAAFNRHERIAFQFSGGRDSTAALYLLRPYWDRMTVYHLDTGDQFPETRAVVDAVAKDVPIVRVLSDVAAVRAEFGMPSDIVPVDSSSFGRAVSGRTVALQSRYECCARALMNPMHARMVQDGITLLVRGQRDDEYAAPPMRSGDVLDGFEVLYPIQGWTGEQVSAWLVEHRLPLAPFYERGMKRAPECMGCTAWWDEGRAAYLKQYHPEAFTNFYRRIDIVRAEIDHQGAILARELEN